MRPRNFSSGYLPKRNENLCPQKDLNKDVHSSFIHNSQKCNTPHISINMKINCRHPSNEGDKLLVCAMQCHKYIPQMLC